MEPEVRPAEELAVTEEGTHLRRESSIGSEACNAIENSRLGLMEHDMAMESNGKNDVVQSSIAIGSVETAVGHTSRPYILRATY